MSYDIYQQFSVRQTGQRQPKVVNSPSSVPDALQHNHKPWRATLGPAAPNATGFFGHRSSYPSLGFTNGMPPGMVNFDRQHSDQHYTSDPLECPAVMSNTQYRPSVVGEQFGNGSEIPDSRRLQQLAMWNMHQASSSYGLGVLRGVYPEGYVTTTGGDAGGGIEFNMSTVRGMNNMNASRYAHVNNAMNFNTGLQTHVSGDQPSCSAIPTQIPSFNQVGGGVMPYSLNSIGSGGVLLDAIPSSSQRSQFGHNGLLPHYGSLTSAINPSLINDPGQLMSGVQFTGLEPNGFSRMPHEILYHKSSYPSATVANVHPSILENLIANNDTLRTANVDSRQMDVQPAARGTAGGVPQSFAQLPSFVDDRQISIEGIRHWAANNEGLGTSLPNEALARSVEKKKRSHKRRRSSSLDSEEGDVELADGAGMSPNTQDTSLTRQARYELRARNRAIAAAAASAAREEPDEDLSSETQTADDSDLDPTWQDDQDPELRDEVDRNTSKKIHDNSTGVEMNRVKSVTVEARGEKSTLLRVRSSGVVEINSSKSVTAETRAERTSLHESLTLYEDIINTENQLSLLMDCYDDSDDVTSLEQSLQEKQRVCKVKNIQRPEITDVTNEVASAMAKTGSARHPRNVDVPSRSNSTNDQLAMNVSSMTLKQILLSSNSAVDGNPMDAISSKNVPSQPGQLITPISTLNQVTVLRRVLPPVKVLRKPEAAKHLHLRTVPNNYMLSKAIFKENSKKTLANLHLELMLCRPKKTALLERMLGWQPSMGICSTQKPCSIADNTSRHAMSFQCSFCPLIGKTELAISDHVARRHREMNFSFNQASVEKNLMYLYCRHCDFVSYDQVMMLLHFDSFHSVSFAVRSDSSFCPNPIVAEKSKLCPSDKACVFPFFCCTECDYMSPNRSHATDHVASEHASRFSNCFVPLILVGAAESKDPVGGESTYLNRAQYLAYASLRKNVYACVRCYFISFQPFCTLSHNLLTHRTTSLAFVCDIVSQSCEKRFSLIADAKRHLQMVHGSGIEGCFQMKVSVTLVNLINGTSAVECFFQPGKVLQDDFRGEVIGKTLNLTDRAAIEIDDDSDEDVILVSNETFTGMSSFSSAQAEGVTADARPQAAIGSGVIALENCSTDAMVPNSCATTSIPCGISSSLQEKNATSQSSLNVVTVCALPHRINSSLTQPGDGECVVDGISRQQNQNTNTVVSSKDCVIDLCADDSESLSVSNIPEKHFTSLGSTALSNNTSQQNQNSASRDGLVDLCAVNSDNVLPDACVVLDDSDSSVTSPLPAPTGTEGDTNIVEVHRSTDDEDCAATRSATTNPYRDCIWAEVDPCDDDGQENRSSSEADAGDASRNDETIATHSSHPDTLNLAGNVSSAFDEPSNPVEHVNTSSGSRLKRLVSYRFNRTTVSSNHVSDTSEKIIPAEQISIITAEEIAQLNDLP